jgi:dipeptidyl aminopeptidase/acylaminoacyl peptidase
MAATRLTPSATSTQQHADDQRQVPAQADMMTAMIAAKRIRGPFLGMLLMSLSVVAMLAQTKPDEVVFDSGNLQLHGFLWKPAGNGPFPAVVWNHGSEKLPGSQPALAHFYTEHSYVFFAPHRRGQGRSPGPYIQDIQDLIAQSPPAERAQRMISLQEEEVNDVVAALAFIKSQPFVDASRIALSGCHVLG